MSTELQARLTSTPEAQALQLVGHRGPESAAPLRRQRLGMLAHQRILGGA
jgi:hypothetical protein